MGIAGIGHLHPKPTTSNKSIDLRARHGFVFALQWGSEGHRVGRLECNGVSLVPADVHETTDLFGGMSPLSPTHWGTHWIPVTDPDDRGQAPEQNT